MDSIGGQIAGYIYNNSNSSISGTLISAVDSAGNTVSSSVSVFNGSYLIPSLKDGNYTIKASKIGYQTSKYFNKVNMDLNSKPFIDGVDIYFTLTDAKKDKKLIPEFYKLSQNYPNPFNPSTTIQYEIPKESFVSIKVYNIIGREIAILVNEQKTAGYYQVQFDAANIPTGIYFCRINAGNYSAVNKMLLLK
jgi:5-hydroxyisourate hydrolase-like protein (transthyretin family)